MKTHYLKIWGLVAILGMNACDGNNAFNTNGSSGGIHISNNEQIAVNEPTSIIGLWSETEAPRDDKQSVAWFGFKADHRLLVALGDETKPTCKVEVSTYSYTNGRLTVTTSQKTGTADVHFETEDDEVFMTLNPLDADSSNFELIQIDDAVSNSLFNLPNCQNQTTQIDSNQGLL